MSAQSFEAGYPRLDAFRSHLDPALSSGFARRVGIVAAAAAEEGSMERAVDAA